MFSGALAVTITLFPFILSLNLGFNEQIQQNLQDARAVKACQIDQSFGYVLLAIQWAPSFCANTACGTRNRNEWTIHGAWPQHTNNSWPQYCCFESEFNVTKIKSLEQKLITKWPTLKATGLHEDFWKHEWTKHGTCSMNSDKLKGHFNYFNGTLGLFDTFPLQSWLSSSGIVASNTTSYGLTAIHKSIEQRIGNKRVELECLTKTPTPLLQHIYICLDKITLKPIDCTRADDKQCGNSTVLLPVKG